MRITAHISTAGEEGQSRFPVMEKTIDDCLNLDGTLSEEKIRKALNISGVTFSSGDCLPVYHFAALFLQQLHSAVNQMAKLDGFGVSGSCDTSKIARHAGKRMDKGYFAYTRVTFGFSNGMLRARVGYANPKEVVGNMILFAEDFAELFARILLKIAEEFRKNGCDVVLESENGCSDVFKAAAETNDWCELKKAAVAELEDKKSRRSGCPHLCGGFCSPAQLGCPCFVNGMCPEPVLDERFRKDIRD